MDGRASTVKFLPISLRWKVSDTDGREELPEATELGGDWLVLTSVFLALGLLIDPSDSAEVRDGGKAGHF